MPLPQGVTRINRAFTNRLMRPVALHSPGFGIVVHRGRSSGSRYETPVNVFYVDGGVVIALAYGEQVDWLGNVLAAGRCEILSRNRPRTFTQPRVVGWNQVADAIPPPVRALLGLLAIDRFLLLDEDT